MKIVIAKDGKHQLNFRCISTKTIYIYMSYFEFFPLVFNLFGIFAAFSQVSYFFFSIVKRLCQVATVFTPFVKLCDVLFTRRNTKISPLSLISSSLLLIN